jgi:hypothetical protein
MLLLFKQFVHSGGEKLLRNMFLIMALIYFPVGGEV